MTSVSRRAVLAAGLAALVAGCNRGSSTTSASSPTSSPARTPSRPATPTATPTPAAVDPAAIAARATVPVLCWHQLRPWRSSDSAYDRSVLICPPATFRAQLDALVDAGYTTIGPDDYLAHLTTGAPLPPRPVMLSFDDSQGTQISEGLPALQQRRLTATFFVMTVVLGNKGWMSADDVRRLDAAGMTVAAHTWDHHRVDRYTDKDWQVQLEKPRAALENLVGEPVVHFAFPFGVWNDAALPHLVSAGYRTAFQLNDKPVSQKAPLLTLRRRLVDSTWTGPELLAHLDRV